MPTSMLASLLPAQVGSYPSWSDFTGAFELFRDPLLAALIAGAVLGFLSVYIVLRRMVFVSAAVTQSAGLGVALSFYAAIHLGLTIDPVWAALGASLVATLLFVADPERLHLTRESLLGLVFAFAGGATVMIGDRISQEAHDIQSILFGTAVLVRRFDLDLLIWVGATSFVLHVWWFRGLSFASFDRSAARVQGLPVRLLDATLFVSIGAMVGVATRALGSLPVFALSTLPAMAVLLLGLRNLRWIFVLAALLGAVAGVGGYLLAFFRLFPVGGAQTVLAALLVVAALLVRASLMLVARLRRG